MRRDDEERRLPCDQIAQDAAYVSKRNGSRDGSSTTIVSER